MIRDIGAKFLFGTIPTPAYDIEVKVTDLEIYGKVLHHSFKFLCSTIPTPAYDLEVTVTDLEIYGKVLRQSFTIS